MIYHEFKCEKRVRVEYEREESFSELHRFLMVRSSD